MHRGREVLLAQDCKERAVEDKNAFPNAASTFATNPSQIWHGYMGFLTTESVSKREANTPFRKYGSLMSHTDTL